MADTDEMEAADAGGDFFAHEPSKQEKIEVG
jgi:hypothetical protein